MNYSRRRGAGTQLSFGEESRNFGGQKGPICTFGLVGPSTMTAYFVLRTYQLVWSFTQAVGVATN